MQQKPDKPPYIPTDDIPQILETFADSLGSVGAGDGVFKIEFQNTRLYEMKDAPPKQRRVPTARVVLTTKAAVTLCNMLNNILGALEDHGAVVRNPGPSDKIN